MFQSLFFERISELYLSTKMVTATFDYYTYFSTNFHRFLAALKPLQRLDISKRKQKLPNLKVIETSPYLADAVYRFVFD